MSPTETAVNLTDSASVDFEFPSPGSKGYDEWRKTGKLPSAEETATEVPKEKEEKPAPKEVEEAEVEPEIESLEEEDSAPSVAVTRPVPATGKSQGKKKTGDERIRELANTNRLLQERLDALERRTAQPQEVKREPAAPLPAEAKAAKPKLGDNDPKTGKPFASIEAWSDAVDAWKDKEVERIMEERLGRERQTMQQTEYRKRIQAQTQQRTAATQKKYSDYIETVTNPKLLVPATCPVDLFLTHPNTKNEGEISYFLGKHPEVLESFYSVDEKTGQFTNKVDPIEQVRYLSELDSHFEAEKATSKPVTPARTITQAPRPTVRVSGNAPTADPLAKAVEEGDQGAYARLSNENDPRVLAIRNRRRR